MACNIDLFFAEGGHSDIVKHSISESHMDNFKTMRIKHCKIFFVITSSAFSYSAENYQTIYLISA